MFVGVGLGVMNVVVAAAASGSKRALSEPANHTTVTVSKGTLITVTLHSTYWSFHSPSGALSEKGSPVTKPAPIGKCVPGGGCGTVTARFIATRAGTGTISAARTTCGEAMLCRPSQRTYTVKVKVTG